MRCKFSYILNISMVERRIHFVCSGNTFRSRLAEAYAKSLKLSGYTFSSSGVNSTVEADTLLSPYARDLARKHRLTAWLSKHKTQTSTEILGRQDIIIFMDKDVYDDVQRSVKFDARKSTVWNVHDLKWYFVHHKIRRSDTVKINEIVDVILQQITSKVRALISDVEVTSWSDMYDEHNKPLGYSLPVSWATQRKSLWRRSVHAVVTTADKKYVVEKRSANIVFSPSMLDISLGGGVDSGEPPRRAVLRELKEELGVLARPERLTLLDVHKWSSYHPHYKKYTHSFLYDYHVALSIDDPIFILQPSEVREVRLLSGRQVLRLLRRHSLKHFGRLNYGYKYYADVVKRAKIYTR